MDTTLHQLLLATDDPERLEYPAGFDGRSALARVRALVPALEAIVGERLTVDDGVQDASFFADIACHRPAIHPGIGRVREAVVAVRFSCFADFFTVTWAVGVDPATIERVVATVAAAGFVYLPAEALQGAPYDGPVAHRVGIRTWWTRFFDYL